MNYKLKLTASALFTLALISCGGGSSTTKIPEPPTAATNITMTVSAKALNFSWSSGSNVDHYRISVNPDGVSGFSVKSSAANIANSETSFNLDIPVHRTNWLSAQYVVEACNADESSCVSSSNQTHVLADSVATTIYIKASNPEYRDFFGHHLSLSGDGNTLAVGASGEDSNATGLNNNQADNSIESSGAVYVYTKNAGTWSQQAYIKSPSLPNTYDVFGLGLSLSDDGNTLAISAQGEDSSAIGIGGNNADNSVTNSGAVYVFKRTGNTWTQQTYLKPSNTGAEDRFGYSISLSGDGTTLAVGSYIEDSATTGINGNQADNTSVDSGAVYVYSQSTGIWSQQAYVKASNTEAGDFFGVSVSLSDDGNTLAVGAYGEDSSLTGVGGNQLDNAAIYAGAAYVFSRTTGTWSQQAYIKASNTEAQDYFGYSLILSGDGNSLAVDSLYEDSTAKGINGDQTDNTASDSGAVYVFTRSGNTWSQQAYVKASNTDANDAFGNEAISLSADGNILAVGAYAEFSDAVGVGGDDTNNLANQAGAAYVFIRSGGIWAQKYYVKASNMDANDRFGAGVSLSSDGNTLAVGASNEASAATGVGENQSDNTIIGGSGAVYLY